MSKSVRLSDSCFTTRRFQENGAALVVYNTVLYIPISGVKVCRLVSNIGFEKNKQTGKQTNYLFEWISFVLTDLEPPFSDKTSYCVTLRMQEGAANSFEQGWPR